MTLEVQDHTLFGEFVVWNVLDDVLELLVGLNELLFDFRTEGKTAHGDLCVNVLRVVLGAACV